MKISNPSATINAPKTPSAGDVSAAFSAGKLSQSPTSRPTPDAPLPAGFSFLGPAAIRREPPCGAKSHAGAFSISLPLPSR